MECRDVVDRLPWLLNGSLPPAEAEAVRAHLASCEACRAEWAETRAAASVFDAHLPTSTLVDLAWDRAPAGITPEEARAHLDTCAACREELDLARESRRLEGPEPSVLPFPAPPPRRAVGRFVVPAATLAAGLLIGLATGTLRTPPPPVQDGRVAALETEAASLRGEAARLQETVASLESAARERKPRVNLPLFELIPGVVRGGGPASPQLNTLTVPPGAEEVVLLLSLPNRVGTPATAALVDAAGASAWKADGLVSGPPGGYVLTLPTAMLTPGTYTISLRPQGDPAIEFRFEVRR